MLRILLVFWLILYSVRYRNKPWNFFQLNHTYFNRGKNIFSKLDLDENIPHKWRLHQIYDDGQVVPEFPVFVKPEWGQNSHGVGVARDSEDLSGLREKRGPQEVAYLLQEAAMESREFEYFYIRSTDDLDDYAVASLTETVNRKNESLVINGINNSDSAYKDLNDLLSKDQRARLWKIFSSIGNYSIARVGVKANSLEELIAGSFHVMEVNIFLPMPLTLLDSSIDFSEKHQFIRKAMRVSAKLCGQVDFSEVKRCPIFFKQLVAHYKVKE